eukprot:11671-Heterococcus_DN1.PRE.2
MNYYCTNYCYHQQDGGVLSNEEITGLLIALLFAGQHTSSISSTWTTVFAMLNPDIMKRLQDEQRHTVALLFVVHHTVYVA